MDPLSIIAWAIAALVVAIIFVMTWPFWFILLGLFSIAGIFAVQFLLILLDAAYESTIGRFRRWLRR